MQTFSRYTKAKISIVIYIIISSIIVDISFGKIYDFVDRDWILSWGFDLFIFIAIVYMFGQYFILKFTRLKANQNKSTEGFRIFKIINKRILLFNLPLILIMITVMFQMLLTSHYSVIMLALAIAISYTLSIVFLTLLSISFFSWFKSVKSGLVLLYGVSSSTLVLNAVFTLFFIQGILVNRPPEVWSLSDTSYGFANNSIVSTFNSVYVISSVSSFVLTWSATVILLHPYFKRLGKIKYPIISTLPLIYFLSQFLVSSLNLLSPLIQADPIFYVPIFTVIFALSRPIGGILFGFGFWIVAKSVGGSTIVRDYMIISAYGFMLLFISGETVVGLAHYPPFGLATVSLQATASYMVLVGIYSSAAIISIKAKLRQSIRQLAVNELKLLDNISTAQMENDLQRRVIVATKRLQNSMIEQTGVDTALNEEEMREYLNMILEEYKSSK